MGQHYQVKDFEPVTTANGIFFPSLLCRYPNGSGPLHEIVFCTDTYGKPKRCTSKHSKDCSGSFEFPKLSEGADPPGGEEANPPADPPGGEEEPEFLPCSSSAISRELPPNAIHQLSITIFFYIFYFLTFFLIYFI